MVSPNLQKAKSGTKDTESDPYDDAQQEGKFRRGQASDSHRCTSDQKNIESHLIIHCRFHKILLSIVCLLPAYVLISIQYFLPFVSTSSPSMPVKYPVFLPASPLPSRGLSVTAFAKRKAYRTSAAPGFFLKSGYESFLRKAPLENPVDSFQS